jgi:hypothetical protein
MTAMYTEWSADSLVGPSPDQISCELGHETVILQCTRGVYYGLNQVATSVWRALRNGATFDQLVKMIVEEFDVTPERCREDLVRLLNELAAAGLIEVRPH